MSAGDGRHLLVFSLLAAPTEPALALPLLAGVSLLLPCLDPTDCCLLLQPLNTDIPLGLVLYSSFTLCGGDFVPVILTDMSEAELQYSRLHQSSPNT